MTEAIERVELGAEKRRRALLEARRRDSDEKRLRVRETVERMVLAEEPITFAAVARHARVSTWLVYAEGVREIIAAGMRQQTEPTQGAKSAIASPDSLQSDLAHAREEIKRLRSDNQMLRNNTRRLLGKMLDQPDAYQLRARADALAEENRRLLEMLQRTSSENGELKTRVAELEDDLAAARTSIRRVIRTQSAVIEVADEKIEPPSTEAL